MKRQMPDGTYRDLGPGTAIPRGVAFGGGASGGRRNPRGPLAETGVRAGGITKPGRR